MKYKFNKDSDLIIKEGGFTVRLWGILMLIFSTFAYIFITIDPENSSAHIPLIMIMCFWGLSLLLLIFVKYQISYIFSLKYNRAIFIFPRFMGVTKKETVFQISSISHIGFTLSDEFSEGAGRMYDAEGFYVKLDDNRIIESNYISSDHVEIETIVKVIADYTKKKINTDL